MEKRPKLLVKEQVAYMESNGIQFNILNQQDAIDFLCQSNYYFKLKAYCKNYKKDADGKYIGLEFEHLVELSKLDSYLRKTILKMSLDIEHFLKVKLLNDISRNPREDGYTIVQNYLAFNRYLSDEIAEKGKNSTCADLIEKYQEQYAVWHFVEVISFNQFISFFDYYYQINDQKNRFFGRLKPVKFLRNAAAHNNCLINNLEKHDDFEESQRMIARLGQINSLGNKTIERHLKNRIIHDFATLCTVYYDVASEPSKYYTFKDLSDLFSIRLVRNKHYFINNTTLASSYRFTKKIVDYFTQKTEDAKKKGDYWE